MAQNNKYGIRTATKEGWQAIRKNMINLAVAFLFTIVISGVIVGFFAIIGLVIFLQFDSWNELAIILTAIGVLIAIVLLFMLQTFINNVMALAFADGLQERKSDVGNLIKGGFKATPRVASAYLSVILVIFGPSLLLGLLIAILSVGGLDGPKVAIAVIGTIAWLCWAVVAGFRYALAPLVALFELKTKPANTLTRSYNLVKKDGIWFLAKGVLLVILVNAALSGLAGTSTTAASGLSENVAMSFRSLLVNLVSIVAGLVAQAAFVAFYFNRRKQAE